MSQLDGAKSDLGKPVNLQTSPTLLAKIQDRDQEAWSRFVRLYGELVYQWCRNAGLQPDDAADVSQEVFQIISAKIDRFDAGRKSSGAFRSWLWGITRLEILDHARAGVRQPVGAGGTDANIVIGKLEDETGEPDSVNGVTAKQLLLKNALEILEPQFDSTTWQSFWRMTIKGDSAKEIGEELGLKSPAVRQGKYRVINKLRELLGDDFPELASQSD